MPAQIVVANLAYAAPDGRPLFADLGLTFDRERTGVVGRNGIGKSTLLRLLTGELRPQAGSVSATGTLGVLRQSNRIGPDETVADLFGIAAAWDVLRRAAAGTASIDEMADADWTLEARVIAALARVGLDAAPDTPLAALSGGQRTRAGLAAVAFGEPDFILLDEPTNDLDRDGRAAVIALLAGWRSGAVVVSHDRELLEQMDAIVELTTLGATRYGGNYARYRELKAIELEATRRDLADAQRRVATLARETQATRERQARRDGAGKREAAKGGIPRILLGGMKDRSEGTGGGQARVAEQRRAEALDAAAAARARVEVLEPLKVELPPTQLPANRAVLKVENVTAGYAEDRPILRGLSFDVTGPERVAIVGPNGSGKTTLLALLSGALAPWSGDVRVMVDFAILDQRVSVLDPTRSIRDNFARLNPAASENDARAALARFMFRADAALQVVGTLSGGQLLRAGLACVFGGARPPPLMILDEPTNHLDIDSIEAVEAGLRAYDGALVVVSHDEPFLTNIGVTRRVTLGAT